MTVQSRLKGIVEQHVGVEGIVAWACLFLCHGVVEWGSDLCLVGKQLAQFEIGSEAVGLVVVGGTLCHCLLQSSETVGEDASREVHRSEVGQL